MSVSFLPTNGSTVAFGDVVVGANGLQTWTASQAGANSYYQTDDIIMSGSGSAQFSASDPGPLYGHDNNSARIVFRPTAIGVYSVTMTVHYEVGQFGAPNGNILTLTYTLTGTGISNPSPPPDTEVAYLLQSFRYLLVPSLGITGKVLSYYDVASLNDVDDASTYVFKSEDVIADRVPTVRRVIITYFDLGVASLNVTVSGVNDQGAYVFAQTVVSIGTVATTGVLATAYADLSVTCYRPQITLTRPANAGSVAISHVVATGTVEKDVTL